MTWWPYCDQYRGWETVQRLNYAIVRLPDGALVTDGDGVVNCPNSGGSPQLADAVAQTIPISRATLQGGVTYRATLAAYPGTYPSGRPDMLWGVQPSPVRSSFQIWGPPAQTGKEPVIIVPGMMGSRLNRVSDGEEVWPNTGGVDGMVVSRSDDYLNDLILSTSTKSQLPGKEMVPSSTIHEELGVVAYGNLLDELEIQGYQPGVSLFEVPYDWRLDIQDEVSRLASVVAQAFSASPTGKVNIVAHSMGGFLVKEFLRTSNSSIINKVILVGVPQLGAPKAFKALSYGDNMGFELGPIDFLNPGRAKIISQNMPGVYELLPSRKYVQVNGGYVQDFRDGATSILSYDQIKAFMTSAPGDSRNTDLLDAADTFHSARDSQTWNAPNIYNIAGCQNPKTIGQFRIYDEGKVDITAVDGDGTVPTVSASNLGGTFTKNYFILNSQTGTNHRRLVVDPEPLALIKNILFDDTSNLPQGISEASADCFSTLPNPTDVIVSIHSPAALHVYDAQNRHVGPTTEGDIELAIPESEYTTIGENSFAFLPAGQTYRIVADGLEAGTFDLKVKMFHGGALTDTVTYLSVPLQSDATVAELAFSDPSQADLGLRLDSNGDATVDSIVQPNSTLTGSNAGDTNPPEITFSVPTEVISGTAITANFSVIDDLSGVALITATFDDSPVSQNGTLIISGIGEHTLRVEAKDNAGNLRVAEHVVNSIYGFSDFLPPVKADGTGIYNQGKTLPIKFQLMDNSDNFISTATAMLTLVKLSDGLAGTEEVPLSTSNADTGNTFRYDPINHQYIYNLSTDSMTPGTWHLKTKLDDGKEYVVEISIRQ